MHDAQPPRGEVLRTRWATGQGPVGGGESACAAGASDGDGDLLFTDAGLATFAGGCTLEAAEAICEADLDAVASLVDKSLLRRTGDRYWMLETIREFAAGTGARLFGHGMELASRLGAGHSESERMEQRTLERLRATLGPELLASELATGATLSLEDTIDLASGPI